MERINLVKTIKKLFVTVLVFAMIMAMSVTAFAAEQNFSITITNPEGGHIYEAYQIFAGDISADGMTLSNIVWGSGVTAGVSALGQANTLAETLKSVEQSESFAKDVSQYLDKQNAKKSVEQSGSYKIESLKPGYYLVKDQDASMDGKDGFYTAYLMKVVGNATAAPKGEKPTLDKEIKNDGGWGNAASNKIGEEVEYRIITSIPNSPELVKYTEYKHTIHDKFSAGLTSKVHSLADIQIKINDGAALDPKYYSLDEHDANHFKVTVDVKLALQEGAVAAGQKLYTYYKAAVNKDALSYDGNVSAGQTNEAHLEYNNNPNGAGHGSTVPHKVYDWTFGVTLHKVKEGDQPLNGAKFVLSTNGTLKVSDIIDQDGNIQDSSNLIELVKDAEGYRVATAQDNGVEKTYMIEAGIAKIKGLKGNVDYFLYETAAPQGYNKLTAPVKIKIVPKYSQNGSQVESVQTIVNDNAAAGLGFNVMNKAGTTLPETGGIGTTVFYVAGSLLLGGAVVLLITRKRMKNHQNN